MDWLEDKVNEYKSNKQKKGVGNKEESRIINWLNFFEE